MVRKALVLALVGCAAAARPAIVTKATQPPVAPQPVSQALAPRAGQLAPNGAVLDALTAELDRAMKGFGGQELPPYFITLQAHDLRAVTIRAQHGKLIDRDEARVRMMTGDVRVGNAEFDSTHDVGGYGGYDDFRALPLVASFGRGFRGGQLPIDDDAGAVRVKAWEFLDRAVRAARQRYAEVKRERDFKASEEDPSGDLTQEKPAVLVASQSESAPQSANRWAPAAERLSSLLGSAPEVLSADVMVRLMSDARVLTTSEGTRLQTNTSSASLALSAEALSDDGMRVRYVRTFQTRSEASLPAVEQLESEARMLQSTLLELRRAELAEPYTGPAILESRAAAVFFHEVLGHRLESQRQRRDDEGQTFAKKLGQQVLPSFLSLYDDPTLVSLGGTELAGYYEYDDEGVPAQRAVLVDHGVLKAFLMGRKPTRGFNHSNGHGRGAFGMAPVARQGNLVVEASERVPASELRKLLLEEVRRQGKPYGLRIAEVDGGFTLTGREMPQAFKVRPVLVYRVPADGGPDVLLRGADVVGTPLVGLSKILAAGDDFATFNGVCGAESGPVPVSASSPSLLLGQVEIQLKEHEREKPPLLAAPNAAGGSAP
ncbi:MAG TPA: metallopeptidase TldD-related protein [Polyangiales bacterium]|nr:metallopeptidase TldD-related protein [Polyangiales bacterium]